MRRAARIAAGIAALGAAATIAAAAWIAWPLPRTMLAPAAASSVTLEDRSGVVLRTTRAGDGTRARWTPLAEIAPDLLRAFVAVEDARFPEHAGVDLRAIARATRSNVRAGRVVSGASTVSMQTARLLVPGARTWGGKVAQGMWALRLEAHLPKTQILEQYLNRVHLGQGTVGVAAAARLYFAASAGEVSLGQAALLAGLARSPSANNPLVSPARALSRRRAALARMAELGYISPDERARAEGEPLLAVGRGAAWAAPHFTTRALLWARADTAARDLVVRTSLDLALQRAIEAEVRRTVSDMRDRGVQHAAAVVLDNRSGEILAWVGSPDFWADTAGQTDMVISARQPGSALKPFLYGLAFDRDYTPASILADVPRTYVTATGAYRPRNYDRAFRGPVRAREALASSYNVPAVELADRLGAARLLETLHLAGFASLARSADHYGLGLALGNGDVTLLEMANAYRALANRGAWRPTRWRAVSAGEARATEPPGRRVMSERSAALVLDILADPEARVPGFGIETPFDWAFPVAVKTGTSRHFTDNWAVGTTERFTVAVWAGNFSGRPMDGVSGVTGAGPLLHRAVLLTASRYPPGALPTPQEAGATPVPICRLSGLRATAECASLTEWFAPGTEPARADDWEQGGRATLPVEFAEWAAQHVPDRLRTAPEPAAALATTATRESSPAGVASSPPLVSRAEQEDSRFRIVSPRDGDRYGVPPGVDARYATVALRAAGAAARGPVRWFVDGRAMSDARLHLVPGEHLIRARTASGEEAVARIVVGGQ